MPWELMKSPFLESTQRSGVNGEAASWPSHKLRKYLKSAYMVRYLSQRSRSNEPYKYSRSVAATLEAKSPKLNNWRSDGTGPPAADTNCVSWNWLDAECGVGVLSPGAGF